MTHLLSCLALLGATACAAPTVRGGETSSARRAPAGARLASFRLTECRDAAGRPFEHGSRVFLVRDPEGGRFLVDAVPTYDVLVVRNRFEEGGDQVFQAILADAERKPVLLDYRIPVGGGDGRMAAARWFAEVETGDASVRAQIVELSFACRMIAEDRTAAAKGAS